MSADFDWSRAISQLGRQEQHETTISVNSISRGGVLEYLRQAEGKEDCLKEMYARRLVTIMCNDCSSLSEEDRNKMVQWIVSTTP